MLRTLRSTSPPLLSTTLLLLATQAVLSGCGGHKGGSTARRGKLHFSVQWPTESEARVIPSNAQSLVVEIKQSGTMIATATITRPATTWTFNDMPTGNLTVQATAYASTDGTGTPLATANVPTTVNANATANVSLTLASTIDHLEVVPNPFTVGALLSGTLIVTARDANNAVVLLSPTNLSFASSNPSVISVTSAGLVTAGSALGSATITVTEADSGKSLSVPVTVVPAVSLTPTSSSLTLRGTATFIATVVGPIDTSVTWSVQEGSAGGAVTSGGVYTAPNVRGTYHVIATSVADPNQKATATITVAAGSINATVQ